MRCASVVQLDRASDSGSECWGFESLRACQTRIDRKVCPGLFFVLMFASVANQASRGVLDFLLLFGIKFLSGEILYKIKGGLDMNITNQDYGKLVSERSKPSPMGKNMMWAFVVGGGICTLGQGLLNLYQRWGLDQEQAGTAVSITLIFAAAVLTGLGVFDKIAKRAGAGTLVPITGFANAMVSPALEFKSED